MQVKVELQLACTPDEPLPDAGTLEQWARCALETGGRHENSELTLRLVERSEIRELNSRYRHQDRETNILSFEFECPPGLKLPLIGDLVICWDVLKEEAAAQHKTTKEHLALLLIHGCLHLIGYDHLKPEDAAVMEPLEITALKKLGFADPYNE